MELKEIQVKRPEAASDVTGLLIEWNAGDRAALDELMPLVYRELHVIARRYLRKESKEITLQTTALVHEAYLRLSDQTRAEWRNRTQFYAVAANIMRRILIDHARKSASATNFEIW